MKDYKLSEIKAICEEQTKIRNEEREQGIDADKTICYGCECDEFCWYKCFAPYIWTIGEEEDDETRDN